jgi:hypothetical protein
MSRCPHHILLLLLAVPPERPYAERQTVFTGTDIGIIPAPRILRDCFTDIGPFHPSLSLKTVFPKGVQSLFAEG